MGNNHHVVILCQADSVCVCVCVCVCLCLCLVVQYIEKVKLLRHNTVKLTDTMDGESMESEYVYECESV